MHNNKINGDLFFSNIPTRSNLSRGKVKWFNRRKGYGFITVITDHMNNKDIFVHKNAIKCTGKYKYLVQGEYVDYEIIKTSTNNNIHEFEAYCVTGVMGGNLMCEINNNLKKN